MSFVTATIAAFPMGLQVFGDVTMNKVQMRVSGTGILPQGCTGGG